MVNRIGTSWQLWLTLAVIWTLVAAASAWLDLPRASNTPHDPGFLRQLSSEAAAIVSGSALAAEPARGALWSDTPRLVRMSNGEQLALPAFTTSQRAAIVESEYRQILNARAAEQRWPFLIERLAWWLAPLLIAGGLFKFMVGGYRFAHGRLSALDQIRFTH